MLHVTEKLKAQTLAFTNALTQFHSAENEADAFAASLHLLEVSTTLASILTDFFEPKSKIPPTTLSSVVKIARCN